MVYLTSARTWPTTYLAYSSFQAATWSHCSDSECTLNPTTISLQKPIVYPTTAVPESLMPVPWPVVESIMHDASISLPFNVSTCTARNAKPEANINGIVTLATSIIPSPSPTPRILAPDLGSAQDAAHDPAETNTVTAITTSAIKGAVGDGPTIRKNRESESANTSKASNIAKKS